jgi:hypothetical protein
MTEVADFMVPPNGRIGALDRRSTEASSVAIRDDRFQAVGEVREIMGQADPGAQRIDLNGPRSRFCLSSMAVAAGLVATAITLAANPAEAPFLEENRAAMHKMMAGMEITPSGDVDRDFAAMMIPHHQGAIDMAQAELRYGHNKQLRRIAQEIIVEQQQEIAAMRMALGEPLPPSVAVSDKPSDLSAGAPRPATVPMMNMQKEP